MSTNPQLRAYVENDHATQGERVKSYIKNHFLCTIDEISRDLQIPKSTVTARLSPLLKSGEVGMREPDKGNTEYFATESEHERLLAASKYKKRNHPVTKLWARLKKEGKGSQTIYANLMAVYNELEGTNF